LETHLGAVSGQCSALVHCTHVPSLQIGVVPEQLGLQSIGASGPGAASVFDEVASPCDVGASVIVDDALVVVHQPLEQCWPPRHWSSVEHAIDGSLAQPAATSSAHRAPRI
jgi:hypothetical protein